MISIELLVYFVRKFQSVSIVLRALHGCIRLHLHHRNEVDVYHNKMLLNSVIVKKMSALQKKLYLTLFTMGHFGAAHRWG